MSQGFLVAGDGFRQLSLLRKRHSEIAMRLGKFRLQAQSLAYVLNGQFAAAHLVGEQAQQVHRPNMLSIHHQDLSVKLFRLCEASRSMVLHGQVERLSYRVHEYSPWPEPLERWTKGRAITGSAQEMRWGIRIVGDDEQQDRPSLPARSCLYHNSWEIGMPHSLAIGV